MRYESDYVVLEVPLTLPAIAYQETKLCGLYNVQTDRYVDLWSLS